MSCFLSLCVVSRGSQQRAETMYVDAQMMCFNPAYTYMDAPFCDCLSALNVLYRMFDVQLYVCMSCN